MRIICVRNHNQYALIDWSTSMVWNVPQNNRDVLACVLRCTNAQCKTCACCWSTNVQCTLNACEHIQSNEMASKMQIAIKMSQLFDNNNRPWKDTHTHTHSISFATHMHRQSNNSIKIGLATSISSINFTLIVIIWNSFFSSCLSHAFFSTLDLYLCLTLSIPFWS